MLHPGTQGHVCSKLSAPMHMLGPSHCLDYCTMNELCAQVDSDIFSQPRMVL